MSVGARPLPSVVWGAPASDPGDAPAIAQWNAHVGRPAEADPLEVTILPGGKIFPGHMQTRGRFTHTGGQLITTHDLMLVPASYSAMDGRYTLPCDVDLQSPTTPLAGDHMLLGALHPHFGHVVLEGLARSWAWSAFAERYPDGQALVFEPAMPDFAWELLRRAGIPKDRLLLLERPLEVERLHVPSPAARTHRWLQPELAAVWQTIGASADTGGPAQDRIYLTRRLNANRALTNEDRIEAAFAAAGFRIVDPERLPLSDQLTMVRQAHCLAGCVGSQMYLAAFQRPGGQTLVLAPSNFLYSDDALIASALDRRLLIAFGTPIPYHNPAGTWTIEEEAVDALLTAAEFSA